MHHVDRVVAADRHVGWRQVGAVEPGLAVDVRRGVEIAAQWPVTSRRDWHGGESGQRANAAGVERGLVQRLVPGDGGNGAKIDGRAGGREQDRQRIVVAWVAVDHDGCGPVSHGRDRRSLMVGPRSSPVAAKAL